VKCYFNIPFAPTRASIRANPRKMLFQHPIRTHPHQPRFNPRKSALQSAQICVKCYFNIPSAPTALQSAKICASIRANLREMLFQHPIRASIRVKCYFNIPFAPTRENLRETLDRPLEISENPPLHHLQFPAPPLTMPSCIFHTFIILRA
jgi:hypothetical protein